MLILNFNICLICLIICLILQIEEIQKRYQEKEDKLKRLHTDDLKNLKDEIDELKTKLKNTNIENEKEISRLNFELQSLKNSNQRDNSDSERTKEYREKCLKLEKTIIDLEHKIALKDNIIYKIESDLDKSKRDYQNLERRMEFGTKNDYPKSKGNYLEYFI